MDEVILQLITPEAFFVDLIGELLEPVVPDPVVGETGPVVDVVEVFVPGVQGPAGPQGPGPLILTATAPVPVGTPVNTVIIRTH
jgi:hypothetical protein